jgi:hypothetical protein
MAIDGPYSGLWLRCHRGRCWFAAMSVALVMLTSLQCDEALPPRTEPRVALEAALYVGPGRYRFRVFPSADSTKPPTYAISPAPLAIQVTSTYDEVLEDSIGLEGFVELWDTRRPNVLSRVNLRGATIVPSYALNGAILTLEAHAKITLKNAGWFHMTVNSSGPMWQGLPMTPDTSAWGEPYFYTDTLLIAARARFTLFKKAGFVESPLIEVPISYEIFPPP